MLYELVNNNRETIVARVRERAGARGSTADVEAEAELSAGVAAFLSQLSDLLFLRHADPSSPGLERRTEMAKTAAAHGEHLLQHGFTLAQVVHDYTEIGRTIVELAAEHRRPLSHAEIVTIYLCVDAAVAGAVTQHARSRQAHDASRLESLARELRTTVESAGSLAVSDPAREKLQHIRASLDIAIEQLGAMYGDRSVSFQLEERLAALPPSFAPRPPEWEQGPAGNLIEETR